MKTSSLMQKARLGAGIIITALSMGAALPAFADSTRSILARANASFTSNGDIFRVNDRRKDGRGAYIQWIIPRTGLSSNACRDTGGAAGSGKTCNYNFREGETIRWRLWSLDADTGKGVHTGWVTDRT
jgi:hypothetical protein